MNTIEEMIDVADWQALNPGLSITNTPFLNKPDDCETSDDEVDFCLGSILTEGYLKTEAIIPAWEVGLVTAAIEKITDLGLPPVFIYIYDEPWQIFKRLSKLVTPVLDADYKIMISGMWAGRIGKAEEGSPIHYLNADKSALLTFEQRLDAIGEALRLYKHKISCDYADKEDLLFEFSESYSMMTPENQPSDNDVSSDNTVAAETSTVQEVVDPVTEPTPSVTSTEASADHSADSEAAFRLFSARKCVVKDCDGQGFGVYTTEKIAAKELIEECHVMPPITQETFNSCSSSFPMNSFIYHNENGDTEHLIVLGFAGIYRHSSHNYNAVWIQHDTAKAFQFYALRDIEPDEEIRINYAMGKSAVRELIPPTKVEARASGGKGMGVFAIADIAEDEVIEDCEVKHLGAELSVSNAFVDYRYNYPKGVGSKKRVVALGLGGVFNHADDNNAYWINHPQLENVFRYVARRNILVGEEVCIYYGGSSYWSGQSVDPV